MRRGVADSRQGMTLLEVIAVMAIILIVSALTLPVVTGMLDTNRVKAARDHLRARWADTRSRAMQEGRPYRFSIIENSGQYRIEPDLEDDASASGYVLEGELPEGVLFVKDSTLLDKEGSVPSAGSGFETLIVYLADGTARDDKIVMFGKAGAGTLGLRLRALTGAVTSIDKVGEEGP